MSFELKVVIAAIKADFTGLNQSKFRESEIDISQLNIPHLFEIAHHHGCVWEVVAYCKFHQLLDDDELQMARQISMQSTMYVMHHEQQLVNILDIFDGIDIRYALLKGAAIYPQFRAGSEQSSRQSADIDLLVDPRDICKAVNALLEYNFHCDDSDQPLLLAKFVQQHEKWFKPRDLSFSLVEQSKPDLSIHIDLHWQVAYPFSLPMVTAEALDRTEKVDIQQRSIDCLSFNDHFILLCIHGYLDRFFILKHLVDIYWAKNHPRFDFQQILIQAQQYGVVEQVRSSCATAELFFDQTEKDDSYAQSVWKRYKQYAGKPPRMHPGKKKWRFKDKVNYIRYQMSTRSQSFSLIAPLIHRLKYDVVMAIEKPIEMPVWLWLGIAYIKKIFKTS